MRTRLRPIIRDYTYARSRRYLRVQCEPLGLKFIARFYPDDYPTVAAARQAAKELCDAAEPILRTAYASTKRDPRAYLGKKGPEKSSSLPPGLGYQPAAFPHRYLVVRWQAGGVSHHQRFRLQRGRVPAIIREARALRRMKLAEEIKRVRKLAGKTGRDLRRVFAAAGKAGAHVIIHD